jgi:hypothetical protein
MSKLPQIHITKTGKKYFIVNGKRIFINSKVTKQEILSIYKLLKRKMKLTKKATNINSAKAIVNINNGPIRRRRRRKVNENKKGYLDPFNTKPTTSGNAVSGSNEDRFNKLDNELNKLILLRDVQGIVNQPAQLLGPPQPPQIQGPPQQPQIQGPPQNLQNLLNMTELQRFQLLFRHHPDLYELPKAQAEQLATDYVIFPRYLEEIERVKEAERAKPPKQEVVNIYPANIRKPKPALTRRGQRGRQRSDDEDELSPYMYQQIYGQPAPPKPKDEFEQRFSDVYGPGKYDVSPPRPLPEAKPADVALKEAREKFGPPPDHKSESSSESANEPITPKRLAGFERSKPLFDQDALDQEFEITFGVPAHSPNSPKPAPKLMAKPPPVVIPQPAKPPKPKFGTSEYYSALAAYGHVKNRTHSKEKFHDYMKRVYGEGKAKEDDGLYNDQIERIMSKFKDKGWMGCIMRDQIKTLLPHIKPHSRISFIINTDPSTKSGTHWQAVYIDARDGPESSNSLEFFDSFGRTMAPDIREDCKLILHCLKPETILKMKENRVIKQKDESQNCGFFCIKFLVDRYRNKSFSESTGFDETTKINEAKQSEKEIERLKHYPPFNYISADDPPEYQGDGIRDNLVEALTKRPLSIVNLLKTYGHETISKIDVYRQPITSAIKRLLNIATFGNLTKVANEENYDDIFHLYCIITLENGTRIRLDKNHRVSIQVNPGPLNPKAEGKTVTLPSPTTLQEFIDRGETLGNQIGSFWRYSGHNDNCQKFIRALLNASGVTSLDSFISQDTAKLIKPGVVRTISQAVTDAAALVDYKIKGGKRRKKKEILDR